MTGKPLLIVLGPTAVGKTELALYLAEQFNAEIVSADSRQIYRYMDIGTAKPTPAQQQRVPHHLIDIADPDVTLSLVQYVRAATDAINHLHTIGRLPLLVGGTGQYLSALAQGWSVPEVAPDPTLRQQLEDEARSAGSAALHARLTALDPDYATRTHPNNIRRVIRALEVCLRTGSTMTESQRKRPPPWQMLTLGLRMERDALYARADQRVDQMLCDGLVAEVQRLLDMGYHAALPALSSIGYREIMACLRGDCSLEEAVAAMRTATHHFIRRQEVWFRGHDHGILWHNMLETSAGAIAQGVRQWLEG